MKHSVSVFFCEAWARILLAFGCCGTGPKHCFLWARILLAFGCCGAGPKHCFFWVPKVTCMRHSFGVFFAWHGLDSCWRSVVSETEALFFMGSKGDVKHSVCVFFAWHGLESCWVFRSFRIWRWRDFERPSFGIHVAYGFSLGRGSTAAGVRVCRNRSFVFSYGFQRWREAFCLRVFCLAWARILLVFRSFRIWRWRDFAQPSFGIHVSNGFLLGRDSTAAGVRMFRNRSFVFYVKAFCLRVFCLAWARILLVFWSFRLWRWRDSEQPSFGIHGVRVFRNVPERTKVFFYLVFWKYF